jgi:site-specific DNA-cytosine methylase
MFHAVDCQGYAGGFTLGMVQAGFKLVGKREMKGGFGVPNCEVNRHLLGNDWKTEVGAPHEWSTVDADVVFGNPPCSGWSAMSAKHFRGGASPVLSCTYALVDYASRVMPQVVVFESVQQAFTHKDGLPTMRALRAYLEDKTSERWDLYHVLHNAYSVGGAAQRKRYFWVASRIPFGVTYVPPTGLPVLMDVIGDLASLTQTWESQSYDSEWPHPWAASRRSALARVDGHQAVDNPLTRRVGDLLAAVDWHPGDHLATVARRYYDTFGCLPPSWAATEAKHVAKDFFMGYTTPIRWKGSEPARVITGGSLYTVVHPTLNRTITHREAARILGFPDDWQLAPLRTTPGLAATHGKGITVDCGRWIGQQIERALSGCPGDFRGFPLDDREFVIDVTNGYKQSLVQSDLTSTVRNALKKQSITGGKMTEPTPETPAPDTETKSKGRPRPDATVQQDEAAFNALAGDGLTKDELATALNVPNGKAYLSLYRLRRDGRIHKTKVEGKTGYVWVQGEAPAEQPAAEAPVAI